MRGSIFFLILCCFTVPASAWQQKSLPIDTIPSKKVLRPGNSHKNLLAFPFVVRSLETKWGFGGIAARFFRPGHDTTVRTSDVNMLGLYTLRSQLILALTSTVFFPHEDNIIRFQASYSYYPDDFWGLGNHTAYTAKEGFSQKQFFVQPQYLKRIHGNIYVGVSYEYQITRPVDYTPGEVFDQENIAGRHGGNTSGIGPILSWDTRNNAYSPDKGGFAEIEYAYFRPFLGSDFKFSLLSIDLRKFFRLSAKSVLALQGLSGLTFGNTPFRKLEELGGTDMMRGYYGGRYTDRCLMAYQAEYRRFLFWRIGMVLFTATGEVASTPGRFELNGFHYSGGGGLRFALSKEEKLNLRIDYGVAKHSNAFTVQLREAF